MTMLAAAILISASVAGPAVNGKVPISISYTPPPVPDPAVFQPVLNTGVENSAGTNIDGDVIATLDAVFSQGSATTHAPAGSGVVKVSISGYAYLTDSFTDPAAQLVWFEKSNVISVDVGSAHGHGHK